MSLIKKVWTLLIRQKKTGWRTEVPNPFLKNISELLPKVDYYRIDNSMLDLIDHLEQLRTHLQKSGVERTTGLKLSMGPTCAYYKKSKDLFLTNDYDRIKKVLLETVRQLELVEGKSISEILNASQENN